MASYSSTNACIVTQNVNVNSVGDTAIIVPFGKFQVEIVKVTNASVDLSASSMTMALYTGPGATGSAVVSTLAQGPRPPLTTAPSSSTASR